MSKKEEKFVDVATIDPTVLEQFVEKYRLLEYEKDLINEQMKGLKEEYKEKHFGKQGLKIVLKALQLHKGQMDVDMVAAICEKLDRILTT